MRKHNNVPADEHLFQRLERARHLRAQGNSAARSEAMALLDDIFQAPALHLKALLLYELGDVDHALEVMQQALSLEPTHADWQNDLGGLFNCTGKLEQAVAHFKISLQLDPYNAHTHYNLGCTLQSQRKLDQAEACYRRALELTPGDAIFLDNLGGCLYLAGKTGDAIVCYRAALALAPENVDILNNLGTALQAQKALVEAIECFKHATEIAPSHARSFVNLGMAHMERGELEAAAACQRKAAELAPRMVEAHFSLGVALHALCRSAEAVACYERALAIDPNHVKSFDNLLMTQQFVPQIDADTLFASHLAYGRQFETSLKASWPAHRNIRDPERKLKVSYVSGDFREHAVAYFIEPMLALHDRSQIEVFCYANQKSHDALSAHLQRLSNHWRPCLDLDDDQLAAQIMEDGIDILVDLSGHTSHNRLLTFARKPAPLQITYVGYLSTSGLSAMDYRLTDRLAEPPGSERYYTEKLLYLPDSTWCFQEPADSPAISPLPALTNGYLSFGSFNNVDKVNAAAVRVWAALLHRVANARLLMLANPDTRSQFIRQFAALGIPASRLEFRGKVPPADFRRTLQSVDIALDSFPVNGATTTCECLWQGVPVLSLAGPRFLSRNGLSILNAAQMPDFAADNEADLINMAALLANNLPLLNGIRLGMREHLQKTTLLDKPRFVHNLETIYRGIWRRWCGPAV
jgi:predicted O-linked N-acetylglucosamine transferase (SPINDLY family)